MKKVYVIFLSLVLSVSSAFALDLSFRLTPSVLFPVNESYDLGYGANAQIDVNLFNIMSVGLEGGYAGITPKQLEPVNVFYGGLGLGAYYYPISRLYVGAGGAFGAYSASSLFNSAGEEESKVKMNASWLYWRGYGEIGFRINPSFTVSANAGYSSFLVKGSHSLPAGVSAGLSMKVNFDVGKKGSGNVDAELSLYDNIYPVYMQLYRTNPAGVIKITNRETAEIRNVKVSFRAGKYTASAMECTQIPLLNKFKSVEVPFMVDFSDEILNFSENGVISGEVVIEYELLGKKKVSIENVILDVNNRNAFTWGDSAALAAFISPDTPEILELAKFCAGIARNNLYTGMNRNIQFAASLFEGLRLAGITYSGDISSPYSQYHLGTELDSVQYPLQTINCLSGDYDDLGILLASCLESIGIPTAFIPYDDDFLLLVSMDVKPNLALNHFAKEDEVLVDDTDVYFVLSMANFEKGFTESRKIGAQKLAICKENQDGKYEYLNTHLAWVLYPSVVYSRGSATYELPVQTELEKVISSDIKTYIDTDLAVVIDNARKAGNDNKLGVALVRAGRYAEAKDAFNRAAKTGSVSAMNNIANVYMYEKNYSAAAAQFKKVLEKSPNNSTAIKGLENANAKLED